LLLKLKTGERTGESILASLLFKIQEEEGE